ncbi:TraB/GumN family protein [Thiocapsa sp.]|uniref:TraB/GumN family protein n=1 Tax=Thiocapsa sp. TaxID=2024551 RepID=UPI002CBE6439|nr:TraB/GumN family protein [Thiocapsa sp.]HSO84079.1 TraB/GumN family protein [Thiocapsa sp.]
MIARLLLAALLATGTCTRADSSTIADAPAGSAATQGILFEIRPPTGAPPSFLFGTIHSEDPRVVELPVPVSNAFDTSPNVALEVVPDASAIIRAMITMAYTDGRLLRDVLPADLYQETTDALVGIGMPEEAFKDLKPWAVVTLLSSPPSETGEFLDMLLFHRAVADGKRVEGLETMTEQLAVFDALSETDQITLLRETLATVEQLPLVFEALIAAYVERDVDKLQHLSEQHLEDTDPRLATLFQEVVIDSRNRRMLERMEPLLAEGGWFIAIGALHLPGDQGVVALLRKRNYGVTAIF